MLNQARFIDPAVLTRIANLKLVAKTVVEGFISGLHRSPYHGFSLDFAEYRQYAPGDDIRSVDWKVYARSDRVYVKKYEGETNTQIYVLLDISKSMTFSSHSLSKLDYAQILTASLAYFSTKQKDATGLVTFDTGIVDRLPPRTRQGHFMSLLSLLDNIEPGTSTDINRALEELARVVRRKSLVVLISDFYQRVDELKRMLSYFHHHGNDIILFHLLDPIELEMSISESSTLEDLETGERMAYFPGDSRAGYQKKLQEHIESIRQECAGIRIDYEVLNTDQPLDEALYRYLNFRERRL